MPSLGSGGQGNEVLQPEVSRALHLEVSGVTLQESRGKDKGVGPVFGAFLHGNGILLHFFLLRYPKAYGIAGRGCARVFLEIIGL